MTCSVDGCSRELEAQSLCATHYMRVRRTGSALGLRRVPTDPNATSKRCLVCGVEKVLGSFPDSPRNRDGRQGICRTCNTIEKRRRHLWNKYGITLDDFDRMRTDQNGQCAICGQVCELVVDHNHVTGVVRGLLCQPCNKMLGAANDSESVLLAAVAYLEQ
jgi:hypothetical protein